MGGVGVLFMTGELRFSVDVNEMLKKKKVNKISNKTQIIGAQRHKTLRLWILDLFYSAAC